MNKRIEIKDRFEICPKCRKNEHLERQKNGRYCKWGTVIVSPVLVKKSQDRSEK